MQLVGTNARHTFFWCLTGSSGLCVFFWWTRKLLWSKNLSIANKLKCLSSFWPLFFSQKSTPVHDLFLFQSSFVNWSLVAYKVKYKSNWNQSWIAHPNYTNYLSHEWRFFIQAPRHQFLSQCPWHLCSTSSCGYNFGELCFSYAFSFSSVILAQCYLFSWCSLHAS